MSKGYLARFLLAINPMEYNDEKYYSLGVVNYDMFSKTGNHLCRLCYMPCVVINSSNCVLMGVAYKSDSSVWFGNKSFYKLMFCVLNSFEAYMENYGVTDLVGLSKYIFRVVDLSSSSWIMNNLSLCHHITVGSIKTEMTHNVYQYYFKIVSVEGSILYEACKELRVI